jgi:hypothetical protein
MNGALPSKRQRYRTRFRTLDGRRISIPRREILSSTAYRSGEELRDPTDQIIHDYTRKTDVIHNETILPKNTPPKYTDRQILWNTADINRKG